MALRDHNTDAIKASGVQRIVTADPHAYNALKHDYKDMPPVEHISQVIAREVRAGKLHFNSVEQRSKIGAASTPITIPATWDGTIRCTTIRATCSTPFPACSEWR